MGDDSFFLTTKPKMKRKKTSYGNTYLFTTHIVIRVHPAKCISPLDIKPPLR